MVLWGHRLVSFCDTVGLVCCHCKSYSRGISENECRCCALLMLKYRSGDVVFVVFEVCLLVILRIRSAVRVRLLVPVLLEVSVVLLAVALLMS